MRIKYEFSSEEPIIVPYFYNEGIQALIYDYLLPEKSKFLHEEGFSYGKRKFKLFTFSKILKKPKNLREKKLFDFGYDISFILSSPLDWILIETAESLIKTESIRFFRNNIILSSVNVISGKDFHPEKEMTFKTISPVTVYSTYKNREKPFYYYSPNESDFFIQIIENLKKKFHTFYGARYEKDIRLKIVKINLTHGKQVVWFKKRPITAWNFVGRIEAEREMLYLAYYAGIGAKNSAGFGCIEEVRNVRGT